ncbi:hypothetical protein D3C72_1891990 [compost metagenome]
MGCSDNGVSALQSLRGICKSIFSSVTETKVFLFKVITTLNLRSLPKNGKSSAARIFLSGNLALCASSFSKFYSIQSFLDIKKSTIIFSDVDLLATTLMGLLGYK